MIGRRGFLGALAGVGAGLWGRSMVTVPGGADLVLDPTVVTFPEPGGDMWIGEHVSVMMQPRKVWNEDLTFDPQRVMYFDEAKPESAELVISYLDDKGVHHVERFPMKPSDIDKRGIITLDHSVAMVGRVELEVQGSVEPHGPWSRLTNLVESRDG